MWKKNKCKKLYFVLFFFDTNKSHSSLFCSGRYESREEAENETNKWDVCCQVSYDVTFLEKEKKHAIISSNRYPDLTKKLAFLRVKWKGVNGTQKNDTVFSAKIVRRCLSSREYINIRELTIEMLDVSE